MQKETSDRGADAWYVKLLRMMRTNRKLELAVYGAIVVIVLLFYIGGLIGQNRGSGAEGRVSVSSNASGEREVEERLKNVLSCIRGAGRVEVMITYETNGEIVTAMTTSTNTNTSESVDGDRESSQQQTTESSEPAKVDGSEGDEPIVLMERQPTVRGVIVVAEGAADVAVRLDLQRAVRAVLDVPVTNIEVFELGE